MGRRRLEGLRMVRVRLKFVVEDIDRHGNVRRYFRQKGQRKIRLRGEPGSEQFGLAYQHAFAGIQEERRKVGQPKPGAFGHLCLAYFASATFAKLDRSTRNWRRRALEEICEEEDDKPLALILPRHIRRLRDEKKEKPGAARNRLKALRALFSWATEEELAPHDPTIGVKVIEYTSTPHHRWTVEEVNAFERRHPIGTKARLAMALLLYTSWRREDAIRLGPQHIVEVVSKDGSTQKRIKYRQAKNEDRNPVDMDIPLHPELAKIIEATPFSHMTFLVTEYGKSYSVNGFGNRFKDWCRQANLPHCSAHGLRSAVAARLAEVGATPHEIMAITGHQTLDEVERYTREVDRKTLADSAMKKLK
jgi:integrase/recombinase XerD